MRNALGRQLQGGVVLMIEIVGENKGGHRRLEVEESGRKLVFRGRVQIRLDQIHFWR